MKKERAALIVFPLNFINFDGHDDSVANLFDSLSLSLYLSLYSFPFYGLGPGFTGFYRVLPCHMGFYQVLLGFTEFYRILWDSTRFYRNCTKFYRVLWDSTMFYWVLPSFTVFYGILLGFTGFYRVLPVTWFVWVALALQLILLDLTGFYRVFLDLIVVQIGFYGV